MAQPKRLESTLLMATPFLYVASVVFSALLISLVVVFLIGPTSEGGEAWQALGVSWALFGIPTIIVLSVASIVAHSRYRRMNRSSSLTLFYLANVLFVAGAAVVIVKLFGS